MGRTNRRGSGKPNRRRPQSSGKRGWLLANRTRTERREWRRASRLSPTLVRLPQKPVGRDLGLLTGRDPYVPILPRVVLQGLPGQREPHAEQRLVRVPDVGDLKGREVGAAARLLILAASCRSRPAFVS